jgi:hypothetical protein
MAGERGEGGPKAWRINGRRRRKERERDTKCGQKTGAESLEESAAWRQESTEPKKKVST